MLSNDRPSMTEQHEPASKKIPLGQIRGQISPVKVQVWHNVGHNQFEPPKRLFLSVRNEIKNGEVKSMASSMTLRFLQL